MTTPTETPRLAPGLTSDSAFYRAPFAPETWRAVAQVWVGWLWLLTAGLLLVIVTPVAAGLVPVLGLGIPLLALALVGARGFAAAERARIAAQTGIRIAGPTPRAPRGPGLWSAVPAVLGDGRAWSAVLYAFLGLLWTSIATAVVSAVAGGGIALLFFPLYGPGTDLARWSGLPWPAAAVAGVLAGVVLVWVAALAAQVATLAQVRLARALLGPSRTELARRATAAEQRAVVLQTTRARAVDAADTERRRIERDLHDGAQQRLVALGVELGAARRRAASDPEAAAAAVEHAHREVRETLAELRDLVRGIHPAVLTDRGLDAALSALAARSPVPVRVDVPDPASLAAAGPTAQAAAYFVVAEALTNVAKHAGAQQASVRAEIVPDGAASRLRVTVSDDGRGGADLASGTGLHGLQGRVAALDGTFDLASPADGGTRLTVEVPCAS